jgi:putative membrane protein
MQDRPQRRAGEVIAMMHNYGGWDAGQWIGMSLLMLLFWGGLAVLIVWAVRAVSRAEPPTRSTSEPTPVQVLTGRLARGEIDADEFERVRELILTSGAGTR